MFLSKIWSVLITLYALAITAFFLLATPPAEVELEEAYVRSLDGAQGLIDGQLRTESRKRLDFFVTMSKDFRIVKELKELGGKSKDTGAPTAKRLQEYLKGKLVKDFGGPEAFKAKFSSIEFVDAEGKVWARIGEGEDQFGDSLKNYPGIKTALAERRCQDAIEDIGGQLQFLWSCPIRYVKDDAKVELVGAVLARKPLDDVFATSLLALVGEQVDAGDTKSKKKDKRSAEAEAAGKKLTLNIAFFRQGKRAAATSSLKLWDQLPALYAKHQTLVDKETVGRSPATLLQDGSDRYLAVLGRLPGPVARPGSYWAIAWKYPTKLGPTAFMSSKIPREVMFKYFPIALFVVGGVVALFLTIFFIWFEGDRPISRLLTQSRDLSDGKSERLDDTKFRGKMGSIARSVNEALERVAEAAPSRAKPDLHKKDLDAILGGPDVATEDFAAPPPRDAGAKPTASILDDVMGGPPPAPSGAFPSVGPASSPPPPPSGGFPSAGPARSASGFGLTSGAAPMTLPGPGPAVSGPPRMPSLASQAPVLSAEDAELAELFEQFVSTKRQCGEPTEGLTADAFGAKIKANRQAVMAKTGCTEVKFSVYIKDGKAALKATPITR